MRRRLSTVRVRLTLLLGGIFLAMATALVVVVNLLLRHLIVGKVDEMAKAFKFSGAPQVCTDGGTCTSASALYVYSGADAPPTAVMRTAKVTEEVKSIQDAVTGYQWGVTGIAIAVFAVLTIAAAWWVAGRMLRPLHLVTATAQRLSLSSLDERIGLQGPRDELKELADTFDDMLARLQRAADSQRRFIADASHELRTPLAVQRAAIEIGLDDPSPDELVRIREDLLQANLRTERLIDGLLVLAQGERGLEAREPVRLDDLAAEALDQHRAAAAAADVTVTARLRPVSVTGDPVLLARLIANLVQNAIRHNHRGGRLHVGTSPVDGVTVRNTGPVIPADRVPQLFKPFSRLRTARTGSDEGAGLGLTIAAAIAAAHDARLTAAPDPGGGLTVGCALPGMTPG